MPLDPQDLRYLDAKFQAIHDAMEPIAQSVTGNGDPSKGLISRVAVLESNRARERWNLAGISSLVSAIVAGVVAGMWGTHK